MARPTEKKYLVAKTKEMPVGSFVNYHKQTGENVQIKGSSTDFFASVGRVFVLGYCSDCVGSVNAYLRGGFDRAIGCPGRSPKKHNPAAWVPRKNRASKNRKSFTCDWVYLLRTQTQSM